MFGGSGRKVTFWDKGTLWAWLRYGVRHRLEKVWSLSLQNVVYGPGVAANPVSVSKATEVGTVAFKGNGCQLEVDREVS